MGGRQPARHPIGGVLLSALAVGGYEGVGGGGGERGAEAAQAFVTYIRMRKSAPGPGIQILAMTRLPTKLPPALSPMNTTCAPVYLSVALITRAMLSPATYSVLVWGASSRCRGSRHAQPVAAASSDSSTVSTTTCHRSLAHVQSLQGA